MAEAMRPEWDFDGRSDGQNRAHVGAASELVAAAHLMRAGYHVYRACSNVAPVDLVALREGEPALRVEVKSGCEAKGHHSFFKPKRDNWDLLMVVDTADRVFVFPRLEFTAAEALDRYRYLKRAADGASHATSGRRSDELPQVGHLGQAERDGNSVTGDMGAA